MGVRKEEREDVYDKLVDMEKELCGEKKETE